MRCKRRPQQTLFIAHGIGRPWQVGPGAVDGGDVLFCRALGKHGVVGQKQVVPLAFAPLCDNILELGRAAGHMVNDQIGHQIDVLAEPLNVVPVPQTRVDRQMIVRIETGV